MGIPSTLEDVEPAALTAVLDGRWAELRQEVRAQLAGAGVRYRYVEEPQDLGAAEGLEPHGATRGRRRTGTF